MIYMIQILLYCLLMLENLTPADSDEIELCVDEPVEMSVDDPDETVRLSELLDGVSVDGPLTMTGTPWIDPTSPWTGTYKIIQCSNRSHKKLD